MMTSQCVSIGGTPPEQKAGGSQSLVSLLSPKKITLFVYLLLYFQLVHKYKSPSESKFCASDKSVF